MAIPLTKAVKILLIANVGIWFFGQLLLEGYLGFSLQKYFALIPGRVLFDGMIWQVVTYMFLHSLSVSHILFNMLMLWFIGSELEQKWGTRFFTGFYLGSGVGAAVIYCLCLWIYNLATGAHAGYVIPVVGASGAIFGLLVAYGIIFGERVIHFMMVFPMKAKIFVLLLGLIEVLTMISSNVSGQSDQVANLAHLGGIASGFAIIKGWNGYLRVQWNRKAKKKNRNLRLVINNEDGEDKKDSRNPKFWN